MKALAFLCSMSLLFFVPDIVIKGYSSEKIHYGHLFSNELARLVGIDIIVIIISS